MNGEHDVEALVETAVKNGDPSQGPRRRIAEYSYSPDPETTGVSEMTVRVNADGEITAAFPEDGPEVAVWIRDEGEWLDNL